MIRIIFICEAICLAISFLDVALTGSNSYEELTLVGKTACVLLVGGMACHCVIAVIGLLKKRS